MGVVYMPLFKFAVFMAVTMIVDSVSSALSKSTGRCETEAVTADISIPSASVNARKNRNALLRAKSIIIDG